MSPSLISLEQLGLITQGITPRRYASDEGDYYPVISVKDLNSLLVQDVQTRIRLSMPNPRKYQLEKNDVVIAVRGSLLQSSVVTDTLRGSVSNQNTVFFRSASEAVNPVYIAALLRSGYIEQLKSFKKMSSTTTLPAIRINDLRRLKIPLPTLSTQHHISRLFVANDEFEKLTLSEIQVRQNLLTAALLDALH